jgi:hypothetical protein
LITSVLILRPFELLAGYYIPKTIIAGSSFGIYYDDSRNFNEFLSAFDLPEFSEQYQYYQSVNVKSNYIPFIFDDLHSVLYSIDIRLPFNRELINGKDKVSLNTYSYFLEFTGFESFLRYLTVHPFVGIGYSQTSLSINSSDKFLFGTKNQLVNDVEIEKSTLLFNLGGGFDYRKKIIESESTRVNLLVSFNAKYSMCLDAWKINDSNWKSEGQTIEQLPQYYAPGLSIELGIGLEFQEK